MFSVEFCREIKQLRFGNQNFNHHSNEKRRQICTQFTNLQALDIVSNEIGYFAQTKLQKLHRLSLRNGTRVSLNNWNYFQEMYANQITSFEVEIRDANKKPFLLHAIQRFQHLRHLSIKYMSTGNVKVHF